MKQVSCSMLDSLSVQLICLPLAYEYVIPKIKQFSCVLATAQLLRQLCWWAVQTLKRLSKSLSLQWKFVFFYEWRHKWCWFLGILAHVTWPRAQPLGRSILLKFSLETRLVPQSFEPLINFRMFLVQKLWPEINKIIKYLISGVIINFVVFRSWLLNRKQQQVIQSIKRLEFYPSF